MSRRPAGCRRSLRTKRSPPKQIDTLKRWVAEGATWKEHWSFTAPVRPQPARRRQQDLGEDRRSTASSWRSSRSAGAHSAAPADRRTLIRRVTLGPHGPAARRRKTSRHSSPTRSPNAYEKVVDRLLASEQWGEHRAPLLARCRALRRHARPAHRQLPRHVAVSRLGDQGLQPQHAVRSVHS